MRQRIGAICRDGSYSTATGRGAGSHHGGVAQWLYKQSTPSTSSTSSSYSSYGSSYGSSSSSWGGGYNRNSGYSSSYSYQSSSNSLFGSLWNGIKKVFGWIFNLLLILLIIVCAPFYYAFKLIQFLYSNSKQIILFILSIFGAFFVFTIKMLLKLFNFVFKNSFIVIKCLKPIFKGFYVVISYLSSKTTDFLRNQHQKGWPMFDLTEARQQKKEQVENEGNNHQKVILDLKKQIGNLQKMRLEIGKDIIELEKITLELINKKDKQIQNQENEIEQLKLENQKIQNKRFKQKEKIQILQFQKQQFDKEIKQKEKNLKISIEKVEIKHKQEIDQLKNNHELQIIKLKQQRQQLKLKLQEKIKTIKQSYLLLIAKKDQRVNDFTKETQTQKNEITYLKNQLLQIMTQHQKEIKTLKQKMTIKKIINKSDNKTQTQLSSNHTIDQMDLSYPNLLQNPHSLSFTSAKQIQCQEKYLKLNQTRSSQDRSFDSQKNYQSNHQKSMLFSFAKQQKSSKRINQQNKSKSSYQQQPQQKIKQQTNLIDSIVPSKNKQPLLISQHISLTYKNQNEFKNNIQQQDIDIKTKAKLDVKKDNNLCLKFFIFFVCLWSVYFVHKLYEIWDILNK